MYIVKPVEEDAYDAIVKKFDDLLVANGATIEKTDKWGKKHLAYPIQDLNEGLYVLTTFAAAPAAVKELDRVMRITDDILRHMITRKGE
jgi:small subunit ribosomal protein S6